MKTHALPLIFILASIMSYQSAFAINIRTGHYWCKQDENDYLVTSSVRLDVSDRSTPDQLVLLNIDNLPINGGARVKKYGPVVCNQTKEHGAENLYVANPNWQGNAPTHKITLKDTNSFQYEIRTVRPFSGISDYYTFRCAFMHSNAPEATIPNPISEPSSPTGVE